MAIIFQLIFLCLQNAQLVRVLKPSRKHAPLLAGLGSSRLLSTSGYGPGERHDCAFIMIILHDTTYMVPNDVKHMAQITRLSAGEAPMVGLGVDILLSVATSGERWRE